MPVTLLPEYVARRVERRRGGSYVVMPVAWGHLYRVSWLGTGFSHRTGDYHTEVKRVEWIAFDPEGHLLCNAATKRDALATLDEERRDPGLNASAWVSTWREVDVEP